MNFSSNFFFLLHKRMEPIKWWVPDIYGIKQLTRLRLNFSNLSELKFRHNFNDTINLMCNCSATIETTIP